MISGLIYQQDSSDTSTITQSGGAVSAIADKTGLTAGAVQASATSQPITGTRTLNGKNVLDFDGSNDYLVLPSDLHALPAGNSTFFIIGSRDSNAADLRLMYGRDAGGGRYGIAVAVGTVLTVANGGQPQRSIPYNTNGHLFGMRRKANSLLPLHDGFLEPVDGGSDVTLTELHIGQYPSGVARWNGTVGEVLIYNRDLSIEEINQVSQYLADKWGLTYTPFSLPTTNLPTDTSYVSFGDSIAAGAGASTAALNWMNLLSTDINSSVLNKGLGGTVLQNSDDGSGSARAGNGRDRYAADTLGTNKRDMIVILYGLNDMRYTGSPSTFNVSEFENDMREVIDGLLVGGYDTDHIVLCNIPYMTDNGYTVGSTGFTGSDKYIHWAYNAACERIAKDYDILHASLYETMVANGGASTVDTDGVHPNDNGHAAIYEAVLNSIKGSAMDYTPNELGNKLALWLDAQDAETITESSSLVSQWGDKSGNKYHATNVTGAEQFIYDPANSVANGLPALVGDATAKRMYIAGNSASQTSFGLAELYIVAAYKDGLDSTFDNNACLWTKEGIATGDYRVMGDTSGSANAFLTGGKFADHDGAYINGAASATNTILPRPLSLMRFTRATAISQGWIIGAPEGSGSRYWNGVICEIIGLSSDATTDERVALEAYLMNKWGISA
jgi:lysophospholipase L1-like esterase